MDDDINAPAEYPMRLLDHRLDLLRVAHVASEPGEWRGRLWLLLLVVLVFLSRSSAGHHDPDALVHQQLGDRRANASQTAGDDSGATGEAVGPTVGGQASSGGTGSAEVRSRIESSPRMENALGSSLGEASRVCSHGRRWCSLPGRVGVARRRASAEDGTRSRGESARWGARAAASECADSRHRVQHHAMAVRKAPPLCQQPSE